MRMYLLTLKAELVGPDASAMEKDFSEWMHSEHSAELEVVWKYLPSDSSTRCCLLPACLQQQWVHSSHVFSWWIKLCFRHDPAQVSLWHSALHTEGHLGKLNGTLAGAHITVQFLCECLLDFNGGSFFNLLCVTSGFRSPSNSVQFFYYYFFFFTCSSVNEA